MFHYRGKPFMEYWRLSKIAKQVRAGVLPANVDKETVWEALKITRPKNAAEVFGFLEAKSFTPDGKLKKDYGLVSCREVTAAFAKHVVDAMVSSGVVLNNFNQHKMGSGSTAETDTQTALVSGQAGAQPETGNAAATHGTSSQIYKTVATITAAAGLTVVEHGIFNASTGGVMLDRSIVTEIALNADDTVQWTYNLTINAGG